MPVFYVPFLIDVVSTGTKSWTSDWIVFVLLRLCCWRPPGGTILLLIALLFLRISAIIRRISPKQVRQSRSLAACKYWFPVITLQRYDFLFIFLLVLTEISLSSGLQIEFINPIFEFSKGMNDLHLDEAEYALLIAINIFSAGPKSWQIKRTILTEFQWLANNNFPLFYRSTKCAGSRSGGEATAALCGCSAFLHHDKETKCKCLLHIMVLRVNMTWSFLTLRI